MRVDGYPYQRNGLGERNSVKVGISTILQRSPAFLGSRATLKSPGNGTQNIIGYWYPPHKLPKTRLRGRLQGQQNSVTVTVNRNVSNSSSGC